MECVSAEVGQYVVFLQPDVNKRRFGVSIGRDSLAETAFKQRDSAKSAYRSSSDRITAAKKS